MNDITIQLPGPLPRNLTFSKQVDQNSIDELVKSILEINSNDLYLKKIYKINGLEYKPKPIKIYIDSYGGQVYQILGLINIIGNSKTPIHTIVTGCAMSCGFMLLISGHKRYAYEHSTLLYHPISDWVMGQIEAIRNELKETERLQSIFEEMVLERTKITKSKLKEVKTRKTDWYISSTEALKLNIIDKIIK